VKRAAMNGVDGRIEETSVLPNRIAHEAIRLKRRRLADVHVSAPANHIKEPQIMRVHSGSPDRRGPDDAPLAARAIGTPPDLLASYLALAVQCRRVEILGMADAHAYTVDQLRRRADHATYRRTRADRSDEVFDATDVC